jgi:hypothetical protein
MRIYLGLAGLSVLVLLFFVGCGESGNRYEERGEAERYGPVIIGPAEGGYRSRIYGYRREGEHERGSERSGGRRRDADPPGDPPANYRANRVEVLGARVRPQNSPPLENVTLTMNNVRYQRNPYHVNGYDNSTFTAQLMASDVNAFLNQQRGRGNYQLRDINMRFRPRGVRMTANSYFDGRDRAVVSTGNLVPLGATQVIYVPNTFTVGDLPLPPNAQREMLNQINPIVDMSSLNFSPQIRRITLGKGVATISGDATVRNMP